MQAAEDVLAADAQSKAFYNAATCGRAGQALILPTSMQTEINKRTLVRIARCRCRCRCRFSIQLDHNWAVAVVATVVSHQMLMALSKLSYLVDLGVGVNAASHTVRRGARGGATKGDSDSNDIQKLHQASLGNGHGTAAKSDWANIVEATFYVCRVAAFLRFRLHAGHRVNGQRTY